MIGVSIIIGALFLVSVIAARTEARRHVNLNKAVVKQAGKSCND